MWHRNDSKDDHDSHSGLWNKDEDSFDPLQPLASDTDHQINEEHSIDPSNLIPADHPAEEKPRSDSRDSDIFDQDIPDELLL